jgi:hypothetical protein
MSSAPRYAIRVLDEIAEVPAAVWDGLAGSNPFVTHAFLGALEDSGCVGARTGWLPRHLVLEGPEIEGVAPCYLKSHSYGEYVFDHAWAHAYERAGGDYYPKLQIAVPFTPVTGPRLLVRPGPQAEARRRLLASGIPIVETWDLTPTPIDMLVGFSHERVGAAVADYLHARGRRRPAVMSGDDERGQRRTAAFVERIRSHLGESAAALPSVYVAAPSTLGSGRRALAQLLAEDRHIDAVCCGSDVMAAGAIIEAHARGLRVPDDLAVIGFGDLAFAADLHPALTTVRIDGTAIGRQAASFIVERAAGRGVRERVVDIGYSIVERDSV